MNTYFEKFFSNLIIEQSDQNSILSIAWKVKRSFKYPSSFREINSLTKLTKHFYYYAFFFIISSGMNF